MGDAGGEQPKPTPVIGSSGTEYANVKIPDPLHQGETTDRLIIPPENPATVKPVVPPKK